MGWRVTLSEQAETDLQATVEFIATRNPDAAVRVGDELVDLILALDELPLRVTRVKARPRLRKLVHRHYLIYYRPNESTRMVEIVRIWDGHRNPSDLKLP